jgi:hypothetical protein
MVSITQVEYNHHQHHQVSCHKLIAKSDWCNPTSGSEQFEWNNPSIEWHNDSANCKHIYEPEVIFPRLDKSPKSCQTVYFQYMKARIKAEYTIIHSVIILLNTLTSVNLLVFYFNNVQIREHIWSIVLLLPWNVSNYIAQINPNMKDYNLCIQPATADTDATNMDARKTVAKMS